MFFEAAALQGHIAACANLGRAYTDGHGVEKSFMKALHWFQIAADKGHQGAIYNCGLLLAQGDKVTANTELTLNQHYLKADPVLALEYFRDAYLCSISSTNNLEFIKIKICNSTKEVTTAALKAYEVISNSIPNYSHEFDTLKVNRTWIASVSLMSYNFELSKREIDTFKADMKDMVELWYIGISCVQKFDSKFKAGKGVLDNEVSNYMSNYHCTLLYITLFFSILTICACYYNLRG